MRIRTILHEYDCESHCHDLPFHPHTKTQPTASRTIMATHELVVPRSIPITSPTSLDLNRLPRENDEFKNETGNARADDAATDDDVDASADRRSKRDEVDNIMKSFALFLD